MGSSSVGFPPSDERGEGLVGERRVVTGLDCGLRGGVVVVVAAAAPGGFQPGNLGALARENPGAGRNSFTPPSGLSSSGDEARSAMAAGGYCWWDEEE